MDIHNQNESTVITGTSGNDSISNTGAKSTINGVTGNDHIRNWESSVLIIASSGDDTVENWGNGTLTTIELGEGNDYIDNRSNLVTINAELGKDFIYNGGSLVTINSGADDDSIYNDGSEVIINAGGGNDSIENFGDSVSIDAGAGNDSILNPSNGSSITINAGDGNDLIATWNKISLSVIDAGNGNDTIFNSASNITIQVGADEDYISSDGNNVLINAESGNNTITNNGENVTIQGGTDRDYISSNGNNVLINTDKGNDTINNWGSFITINTGIGDDFIYNGGSSVKINGGDGDDSIYSWNDLTYNYGDLVTISAGCGNDIISLRGDGTSLVLYSIGDGNDTVIGYKNTDTIQIFGDSVPTTMHSDNDVIISIGGGSIILEDALDKSLNIIGGNVYGGDTTESDDTTTEVDNSMTPQYVIKNFVMSLDRTTLSGSNALDEAIQNSTHYTSMQDAIDHFLADVRNADSAIQFLNQKCGIILDNADTGAITGSDAGGSTVKTKDSIVPEDETLTDYPSSTTFTVNGLTVTVPNRSTLTDVQKTIVRDLYNWWIKGALDLNEESYGLTFKDSDASVKRINVVFDNTAHFDGQKTFASFIYTYSSSNGKTNSLMLKIPMDYYSDLTADDVNGATDDGFSYLDRTLAHEFTHALMAANINYFYQLPLFVTEGLAELTHGIDDTHSDEIYNLASDPDKLATYLDVTRRSGAETGDWTSGYMFFRWLAKQASSADIGDDTVEDDTIAAGGDDTTVDDPAINNTRSNVVVAGTGGNDTINNNGGENVTVRGGNGSDQIFNDGAYGVVNGDAGNDTITNSGNNSVLHGGADNDSITNSGTQVEINGGTGADSITNTGDQVEINGDGGDDAIFNTGEGVLINGGSGSDAINNSSWYNEISGGDGDDSIFNSGSNATLLGGGGDDTIDNTGGNVEIGGGKGNDYIRLGQEWNTDSKVILYEWGDGFDTVVGYENTDTIRIADDSSYTTVRADNDVIVRIGDGEILLTEAADKTLNILGGDYYGEDTVDGGGDDTTVDDTTVDEHVINNARSNVVVAGTGDADTINNNGGEHVTVRGGNGSDQIFNAGAYGVINGDAGDDTVLNNGNNSVLDGGEGDDRIQNNVYGEHSTIRGGAGDDSIINWATNNTVHGGTGNDSITNNASKALINGNGGDDFIYTSADNGNAGNTLVGGTGNDVISLSGGANFIHYAAGDGNDTIYGYSSNETIAITGGIYSTSVSGSNTIIKVGSGLLTVANYTDPIKIVGTPDRVGKNIDNITANTVLTGTALDDTIKNNAADVSIFADSGNDTIYNHGDRITINAGAGADTIYNLFAEHISIHGGAGADSIHGTDNYGTIVAGDGKDTVTGNHWRTRIYGGNDNDLISLTTYWYNTLDGGAGNDTIISGGSQLAINGGKGNDVISLDGGSNIIRYAVGDGNDIIYGVAENDTLTISGATYTASTVGNNVVLGISDGGSITLDGARGKNINVNNVSVSDAAAPANNVITPQDVILNFMKSLDESTAGDVVTMLNQAIGYASGFKYGTIQEVIDAMIADCQAYNAADPINGWNRFLLEKCDIDLYNDDTGAISGYDAGGSARAKTATSIVSEDIELDTSFEGDSFVINGLNFVLAKQTPFGYSRISYNDPSLTKKEQQVWQGLKSGWVSNSLNLIEKSYGSNYSFDSKSSSTLTNKNVFVTFTNQRNNTLASVKPGKIDDYGKTLGPLNLNINRFNYDAFVTGNASDAYEASEDLTGNSYFLERVLVHEFTHAVMDANIINATEKNGLPQFIKDGLAELVHGCDDYRSGTITNYAKNPATLRESLDITKQYDHDSAYTGGYMFMRYMAKQFSSKGNSDNFDVAIQSPSDSFVLPPKGISIESAQLTASTEFNGKNIILSDYGADISKANASALTQNVALLGGTSNDSLRSGSGNDKLYGGDGNDSLEGNEGNDTLFGDAGNDVLNGADGDDILYGGVGNDTLTGGAGEDLFVYEDGRDVVTDYAEGSDRLQLESRFIASSSISGADVVLYTDGGSVTIRGGATKKITVIDADGNETTQLYGRAPLGSDNVSDYEGVKVKSTSVTIGDPFEGTVDAANFSAKLKKIDASKATGAVNLIGNDNKNVLKAGSGGSTLSGGDNADKLYGGSGVDVFVYDGQGKDKIYDCGVEDRIVLNTEISKVKVSGKNVVFTVDKKNTLTLQKVVGQELTITDAGGETNTYVFKKKDKSLEDALVDSAQLPSDDYWFINDDAVGESQLASILDASIDDNALGKLSLNDDPSDAIMNASSGIRIENLAGGNRYGDRKQQ